MWVEGRGSRAGVEQRGAAVGQSPSWGDLEALYPPSWREGQRGQGPGDRQASGPTRCQVLPGQGQPCLPGLCVVTHLGVSGSVSFLHSVPLCAHVSLPLSSRVPSLLTFPSLRYTRGEQLQSGTGIPERKVAFPERSLAWACGLKITTSSFPLFLLNLCPSHPPESPCAWGPWNESSLALARLGGRRGCPSSELLAWQLGGEGTSFSLSLIPEKPAFRERAVWAPFLGDQMPSVPKIQICALARV